MLAHTLEAGTRSHQKKATLTKMKGALLLKCLAALCVLACVGAQGLSGSAAPAPSRPLPSTDELEAFTAKLKAVVLLSPAELEAVVELHAAELEDVRGECEDKKNELEAAWAAAAAAARAATTPPSSPPSASSPPPSPIRGVGREG